MGTILVTGASRGIGNAVARAAAREGHAVAVNYLNSKAAAESLVREIVQAGGKAVAVQGDVSREAGVLRVFAETDARLGRIDGLVNNAGGSLIRPLEAMTSADLDQQISSNFASVAFCCREAVKRMSTANGGKGGAIVSVSSRAAVLGGQPGRVLYAAAKGAVDSFTVGLAREVGPLGIRVCAVRPGLIVTDATLDKVGLERMNEMTKSIAAGRPGRPDEVAETIVFLLSPRASYMTGCVVDVAGGR